MNTEAEGEVDRVEVPGEADPQTGQDGRDEPSTGAPDPAAGALGELGASAAPRRLTGAASREAQAAAAQAASAMTAKRKTNGLISLLSAFECAIVRALGSLEAAALRSVRQAGARPLPSFQSRCRINNI